MTIIKVQLNPKIMGAIEACTEAKQRFAGDRVKQFLQLACDERVLPELINEARKRGWLKPQAKP